MSLTKSQHDLMVDTLQLFAENPTHRKLTDWDRKFLDDQQKRFDEYGEEMRLSEKQEACVMRIYEKLANLSGPRA